MDLMKNTGLLVLVAASMTSSPYLAAQSCPRVADEPGLLASFLRCNRGAATQRNFVGGLESPGGAKAILIAIVAWDPAKPAIKVSGVEVRLEEGTRKGTIYLDHDQDQESERDSLRDFQNDLARITDKDNAVQYWRIHDPAAAEWVTTVGATNRSELLVPGGGHGYVPRDTVLSAGWYKRGDQVGLTIECRGWYYYFPNVSVTKLVDIIAAARDFLEPTRKASPPDS